MESATPAVDQPFVEVEGKEVDKSVVIPPSTLAWSPAATLPLILSFTSISAYTTKEEQQWWDTVYTMNRGNAVPKGLKLVQQTIIWYIQ